LKARKPLWTEGLFMTQHHLQQLDRYYEGLLADRIGSVVGYDWGITELELDERALGAGQIRIQSLLAILPDGTPIDIGGGSGDAVPVRQLDAQSINAAARSVDVYIGLYEETEAGPNVELEPRADSTARYVRDQATVLDYNGGGAEQAVPVARPNLRVLVGDEPSEAFIGVRIARLVRGAGGALQVSPDHIAPVLRVGASTVLRGGFQRLLSAMVAKQRQLAAGRKARTDAAVQFDPGDTVKFWLLHTLNENIPRIAHIVEHGRTHPEVAYLTLAAFVGQLCTFAADADPSTLPSFEFMELGSTFKVLFERANTLLGAVVDERYVQIPLTKREDGMYFAQLEDTAILRHECFLAVEASGVPEAQIRERIPKLMKIASWNQITSILNSAINGTKVELEYRPPGALPLRQGVVFFRLQRTPDFWNDVTASGTIAIYQPINPADVQLSLYAVDPTNLK
jgi:type VI secretion system protein ImpJ